MLLLSFSLFLKNSYKKSEIELKKKNKKEKIKQTNKNEKTVKTKADAIRKRRGSSLQTLMYSSVYSLFRNLARKAQCRGRASGSKGKKGREVLHRSNGYVVESKPSAKGSPAPERWPEDDAYSWPRFWCSVVLLLVENKNESSGVFYVFMCGGGNKQQTKPSESSRSMSEGILR